jgi:hypothetical protein
MSQAADVLCMAGSPRWQQLTALQSPHQFNACRRLERSRFAKDNVLSLLLLLLLLLPACLAPSIGECCCAWRHVMSLMSLSAAVLLRSSSAAAVQMPSMH